MSRVEEYLQRLKKEARELRRRGLEEEAEEIEDEICAIERRRCLRRQACRPGILRARCGR